MEISKQDVINCMFSEWYPKFSDLTMKSFIINLSEEFVKYLQDNGTIILPKGVKIELHADRNSDDDSENEWSEEENEENGPEFPEVINQIKETLERLNHKAFPKLNWSSPKDAVWITASNNLKCSTPGDVILLLKSSDFITFDLTSPFKLCSNDPTPDPQFQNQLVLRKWANLVIGMEFRCFVRNGKLIAVSQRHFQQYYDYIEKQKDTLRVEISGFFKEQIEDKFPNQNYTVDIYKKRDGNFWIIDFNPWGMMTDPLLFTWQYLEEFDITKVTESDCPLLTPAELEVAVSSVNFRKRYVDDGTDGEVIGVFRYAGRDATMQPSEILSHRMPQDFLDLSRGEDATKLVDFLRMKIQTDDADSSDEDETWRLPNAS